MRIFVCLKQVPDTGARLEARPDGKGIVEQGFNFVMNPYDEFAVEEALRLREKFGGSVVVASAGPARVQEALRTALAMGADEAYHLKDDGLEGAGPLGIALALSRIAKQAGFDLILCGKQATDDDSAQVGSILAELLDLPQVTVVTKLEVDPSGKKALARREMDGYAEMVEVTLPAVFTANRGLNEPRYPTLPGIMKAKKKEIKVLDLASLDLTASEVAAGFKLLNMKTASTKRLNQIVKKEPAEAAADLLNFLREQAKAI